MAQDKKDWEIYPERYATNEDGSFVLKKDGTPKKKVVDLKDLHHNIITIVLPRLRYKHVDL